MKAFRFFSVIHFINVYCYKTWLGNYKTSVFTSCCLLRCEFYFGNIINIKISCVVNFKFSRNYIGKHLKDCATFESRTQENVHSYRDENEHVTLQPRSSYEIASHLVSYVAVPVTHSIRPGKIKITQFDFAVTQLFKRLPVGRTSAQFGIRHTITFDHISCFI